MKKILLIIGSSLLINLIFLTLVSNFNAGLIFQGLVATVIIFYAIYFNQLPTAMHIVISVICLATLIFVSFLAVYGNVNNTKYDENAVIVLGAGIHGEQVSVPLAHRLNEAAEYHRKNPNAVIIVCGGQGFQEDITEALAMERYLVAKGVPQESIIKEENSTSTLENFLFAREILLAHFPEGSTNVLITNNFHVYRATKLAQYAGISARHIGAHTEWYTWPVNYLREIVAVCKMWVFPPKP